MSKVILITNHSYMFYQFRRELTLKLLEKHEVVLLTPFVGHEKDFIEMGCRCIEINMNRRSMNPLNDFKLYRTYKKILKIEKPDLVITYSIKPNIYAGVVCEQLKIPYCVNVQGLGTAFENRMVAAFVTQMYRLALKKVKTVFFENDENAEVFRKRKIVGKDKMMVLNGAGVNLDYYAFREYPSDGPIHFIFVGRIMREKGISELLETAKRMRQKYDDQVVFDIVGFYDDDVYRQLIDDYVKQGVVQYHGFQVDVKPFLEKSHCLILPSYHEGMANTILEASSMGRPVIASDIPGCREGVLDQRSGYLVRPKDAEDLYQKVDSFFHLPYALKLEMGRCARKLMEEQFDKQKVVEITYKELMS